MVSSPFRPSDCQEVSPSKTRGTTPMPTRFERWMRSKLSAITARMPRQVRALGRPVARGAGAVFLAGEDDERNALALVAHGGVVDEHPLARGLVDGVAALDHVAGIVLHHLVLDADVGEGAAHHDLVVAAPRAVLVEIVDARPGAPADIYPAGEAARMLPAGEMWSVVIESRKRPRMRAFAMSCDRLRLLGHALEVGRVLHVGRTACST